MGLTLAYDPRLAVVVDVICRRADGKSSGPAQRMNDCMMNRFASSLARAVRADGQKASRR